MRAQPRVIALGLPKIENRCDITRIAVFQDGDEFIYSARVARADRNHAQAGTRIPDRSRAVKSVVPNHGSRAPAEYSAISELGAAPI
jgi:hypothetical protein